MRGYSRRQLEALGEPIGLLLPDKISHRCGGGGKDSSPPPAPNYGPMAAASEKAAELGYELGKDQLAEAKRQYDLNMDVAKPIIEAQSGLMRESLDQGRDYYEYGKRGRPIEDALNAESMVDTTAADAAERNAITGSNAEIEAGRYGADIQQQVGKASADVRQGTTQQMQQLIRQGLRYGYSPAAMAAKFGTAAATSGLGQAAAMNSARTQAIAGARGLMTTGRQMRIQDTATAWGKKMDAAGLYRNMPGASAGAYGLATGAGNAAVGNQMQPSSAYMAQRATGAGMQQTGAGQAIQGYGSILNSQTSTYNAQLAADAQGGGLMGSLLGAGAQLGAAYLMRGSDRRLKEDIVLVGKDERTGLNLYEFRYIGEEQRYRGVMAEEVVEVMPEAVGRDRRGYMFVNYALLGIPFEEVRHG